MAGNYWDNYWRERKSRRRFLGGAVATGAGASALALVGCGDDDDDDTDQLATPTSGAAPTATPVNPLAGAKRGGTLKLAATGDPPTLDPYGNISFLTKGHAAYAYSRLFMYKAGPGIAYGSVRPTPDAAQSAETTPDGLKWTVKLKPNVKFHDIAPVNGRLMNSEDVKLSWERATSATSTNKPTLPVDKVEYPDGNTIVFILKTPTATFLDDLADSNVLWLMPKEAFNGGFDPAKIAIGSGPWVWKSYEPSVKFVKTRNPNWHMSSGPDGAPFFDGVETAIIPEYANRLAQFLGGSTDVEGINSDDLPGVIKQITGAKIEARTGPTLSFTFFDPEGISTGLFKDPRVRQAISMSYDRNALMELGYNVKKLTDAGLKVDTKWHNLIPAGETAWWIDPVGSEMGDAAKFFKYNPTEAKALLSAAGFPNGLDTTYQYTANRYGKLFNDIAEANIAFQTAIGVRSVTDVQDYSSKYITQTFLGNFKGIAFGYETPFPEAGSYLTRFFTDNPTNHSKIKDPELEALAKKAQIELSEEKRKQIFKDVQKKNAEKMYYIPNVAGAGTGWIAGQPTMRNYPEFVTKAYGAPAETYPFWYKA